MEMLEIWKNVLDKAEYVVCAMFMDLSKASDTIHHDSIIANLGVARFFTGCSSVHEKLFN